jgi:hypothetical protein
MNRIRQVKTVVVGPAPITVLTIQDDPKRTHNNKAL